MAFTPLVPVALSGSVIQGFAEQLDSAAIKTAAGVVVDLSAWVSLAASIFVNGGGGNVAAASLGTVTADSSGLVHLKMLTADTTSLASPREKTSPAKDRARQQPRGNYSFR